MKQQSYGGNPAGLGGAALHGGALRALFSLLALLVLFAVPAHAQHRISGRVTAEPSGEALPGVQVQVQGTSVGAITDADGRYTLVAPSTSGVLAFRRIGYGTKEARFNGQSVINATLAVEATELEGIVVVGYGEKARVNLTESIGTISSEQVEKVTVSTPEAAIQGRITGVQLTSESGAPGAPTAVRIRGVGTIGNTQPLFVVDGVAVGTGDSQANTSPLATINPADIESISVLKDASAAAVYGVQAANGVVLITTKRGKLGKPIIRYDGSVGVQGLRENYDVLSTPEYFALWQEQLNARNAYEGRTPGQSGYLQLPAELREGSPMRDQLLARNTDWTGVALRNDAPVQNHNLSVSGASDNVNFYVSAGYFAQDAVMNKWDMDRYSFRANSDFRVNDRIRVGETFSISNQFTLRGSNGFGDGSVFRNVVGQPPIFVNQDPSLVSPLNPLGFSGNANVVSGLSRINMAATDHFMTAEERHTRVLGSLWGEVDILPGLTARSQGSVDYNVDRTYQWNPGFTLEATGFQRGEQGVDSRGDSYGLSSTNTLTYDGAFGRHSLNLLAGFEARTAHWSGFSLDANGFVSQEEAIRRIVATGQNQQQPGGWAGEEAFVGYLGRASYNYADRYLFTASVRRDGASTFAPGHQWGTFPAFSAGWRVSQEPFFNVPWINEFKLRGSWGQLGNSNIEGGAYPHLISIVTWSNYALNGDNARVAPVPRPRLSNPGLTWETNETMDFGFESLFFNNSVEAALTYYKRNTKDFLLSVPIPFTSGLSEWSEGNRENGVAQAPVNGGEMMNSGFEMELGYNTRIAGAVDFSIKGNLTTVNNELLSLSGADEYPFTARGDSEGIYRVRPGFPVGYFYGYQTCGVYSTAEAAAAALPDATISNRRREAGDMCFVDVNQDGAITSDDRTFLGSPIPETFYGIDLSAAWRSFDMTAFFNGVQGVEKYNVLRRDMESMSNGGYTNSLATVQDRWTPENPNASMPRAISGDPAGNNRFSDRWVEDASYLRLKTLQLGYTLPATLTRGTVSNARVYLTGTNLLTLTGYSGLDPEFITTGANAVWDRNNRTALGTGTDWGDIPQPRMFQLGVNFTF